VVVAHTLVDHLIVYGMFGVLAVALLTAVVALWLERRRRASPGEARSRKAAAS
jgi:hypothetical protein